jgi:glutamyl-tRNA reductase
LSVPRNIIINNNYNNVELVDLDKLKDKVNENYNRRISEVKKAEKLIEKYVIEYNQWLDSRELRPSIISIKKEIKNLMSDTVNLENNNREIQEIYDKFSDRLVKKILSVSENGKNTDALNIINKIFTDD